MGEGVQGGLLALSPSLLIRHHRFLGPQLGPAATIDCQTQTSFGNFRSDWRPECLFDLKLVSLDQSRLLVVATPPATSKRFDTSDRLWWLLKHAFFWGQDDGTYEYFVWTSGDNYFFLAYPVRLVLGSIAPTFGDHNKCNPVHPKNIWCFL